MKLGNFENPFGKFDDKCKADINAIINIASTREEEKISVSSTDEYDLAMWVITYDGLLWQLSQIHNLITDEITYELHFVEAVVHNPNSHVEIANDGHLTLCVVEFEDNDEGDSEC